MKSQAVCHRAAIVVFAAVCLGLLTCPGCPPPDQQPGVGATTQPTTAPLPAEALLKFDELTPDVTKPVNREYDKELPENAQKAVEEADGLLAQKDIAGAIAKLERAAGFDPENPRVRRRLAMAYASLPNWGKALENLRKVVRYLPDDVHVQVLLGRIAATQRQDEQAIMHLRTALECSDAADSNPQTAVALKRLGELLRKEGRLTASLQCFNRLRDVMDAHGRDFLSDPQMSEEVLRPERIMRIQGDLLLRLRRPDEAVEMLRGAYSRDSSHLPTAERFVTALEAAGEFIEAEETLVKMASEPSHRGLVPSLAESVCRASGDKSMPARIWRAYRRKASGELHLPLAEALALSAEQMGAHDQAVSMLRSILDEMPESTDVARVLTRIYAKAGNGEQALRLLGQIVKPEVSAARMVDAAASELIEAGLDDDFERRFAQKIAQEEEPEARSALHYVVARLAERRGKQAFAALHYKRAIEASGHFLPAYESLAELYLRQKRDVELDALLKNLRSIPKGRFFLNYLLGKIHLGRGEVKEAIDFLRKARSRRADDVEVLLLLARAYSRDRRIKDAIDTLLEAQKLQPDSAEICRELFDLYLRSGQLPPAVLAVRALLDADPGSVPGRLMLAKLYLMDGARDKATKILEKLQSKDPDNVEVKLFSHQLEMAARSGLSSRRQFDKDVERIRAIVDADPSSAPARRALAKLYEDADLYDEAADVRKVLYEQSPGDPDAAGVYAAALARSKQYAKALEVLRELYPDGPLDRASLLLMLRILEKLEEPDKIHELLDKRIGMGGTDADLIILRWYKLRTYARAKEYGRAVEYFRQWFKDDQSAPKGSLLNLLVTAKQYDKALELLDEWIVGKDPLDRRDEWKQLKIALRAEAGKVEEAKEYAIAWIRQEPKNGAPREGLLRGLFRAEKYDEASRFIAGWIKEFPTSAPTQPIKPDPVLRLCRQWEIHILIGRRKLAEGVRKADEYLKLDPKDPELMSLKSSCLSEQGLFEEATGPLVEAVPLADEEHAATYRNNLAYMYAEAGIRLEEALALIRQAIRMDRERQHYLDTLAWVYYKRGEFGMAALFFRRILRQASDDDPEDQPHPVILDHAGDTYYRLGWNEKAMALWKRALTGARKEDRQTWDVKQVLDTTAKKIEDMDAGRPPSTATIPLGPTNRSTKPE